MPIFVSVAFLFLAGLSSAIAEEIFRREISHDTDIVLSLGLDESLGIRFFNVWKETLPFDALKAADIVRDLEEKRDLTFKLPRVLQVEGVELIKYEEYLQEEIDPFFPPPGKYFYYIVIRRYKDDGPISKDAETKLIGFSHWAVFTNGLAKMLNYEKK